MEDVIHVYQTWETVFHWDIQTLRRELKIRHVVEYFWWNSRCWIVDETLCQVFYISSQSKQKRKEAWKIKASTEFKPMTSVKYQCDALPTELWSHTLGVRSFQIYGNDHSSLSYTTPVQIWTELFHIIILHIISLLTHPSREDMKSIKWLRSQCVTS